MSVTHDEERNRIGDPDDDAPPPGAGRGAGARERRRVMDCPQCGGVGYTEENHGPHGIERIGCPCEGKPLDAPHNRLRKELADAKGIARANIARADAAEKERDEARERAKVLEKQIETILSEPSYNAIKKERDEAQEREHQEYLRGQKFREERDEALAELAKRDALADARASEDEAVRLLREMADYLPDDFDNYASDGKEPSGTRPFCRACGGQGVNEHRDVRGEICLAVRARIYFARREK